MELDRPSMPMQVDASEKPRSVPNTRLHGPWLILARAAWIIVVALSLAVSIADIPLEYARLHTVCAGSSCEQQLTVGIVQDLHHLNLSVDFFATFLVILEFGSLFVWSAIALVIFWRRSNDRVALLVALFLVLFPAEQGVGSPDAVGAAYPSLQALTNVLGLLGGLSFLLFLYLFPDGRFIPRWTRIFFLAFILLNSVGGLFPTTPLGEALSSFLGLTLLAIAVGIGLVAQVYRYRRVSSPVQRQQTKWVVFGVLAAILVFVVLISTGQIFYHTPGLIPVLIFNTLIYGIELLIPLSIGFSILRYRLYDIDVLINRTLVYGTLTILLGLVYVGLILSLQYLLRGIINQNNDVAIVVSTLVIAALFQPLRHRLQRFIDRRFYRSKYDAAKTLEAFSATLRNEVDVSQLREHLLTVVQETMQPAHVSLWLRSHEHEEKHQAPWRANPPVSSDGT